MTTPEPAGATHPLVTAIVPTYNGAETVGRTLESLAAQTWPALEILIGDDGSTDATPQIIEDFAAERDDVRIVRRSANLGWLGNSNDLMSRATGTFSFFAFHDDVVDPTYVERLADALIADESAILSFSDMTVTDVDGTVETRAFDELEGMSSAADRGIVMARRPYDWWVPNRGLFRTSAYERTGGIHRNRSGEYSADWTWLLHLSLLGGFVRVPEVLCHKHYTKRSLSKSWPHDPVQRANLLRSGIDEVLGSSASPRTKAAVAGRLIVRILRAKARRARRAR
ncbi:glycosyltransferase family 2 protein [Microbacter sp. GSS18]|nr:glycosyltransferase family 2 protein [Microbacter sp. GSS18]